MLGDAHIIDVRGRNHVVGHGDGFFPETEVVDAVGTLGHSKVTLSVGTLHTDYQTILAFPLDGTGIQSSITHDALHQVRVILLVEVVFPLQGHMFGSHNRIFVLLVDTIAPLHGFVLTTQQFFMMLTQGCNFLFKISHNYCLFNPLQS